MIKQPATPFVSVIIVNWNRCEDVIKTLSFLDQIEYANKEIIVVDNGSSDDSKEKIQSYFPHVKLIMLPKNIGCEDGNNVGILNSSGDIILFLDSDAHIDSKNFSKLISAFSKDKSIGIVEPRIIRPHDEAIINEPKYWPLKNSFTGCVVAFKASIFKNIGLRPGEFFLYSSEPLIALKAVENNYKIIHRSDIIGYHRESPKARANKSFYFYATRNILWLIWRHYPFFSAIYETIFLILIHTIRSLKDFAFHQFIIGLATGFIFLYKQSLKKRIVFSQFQKARVFPDLISSTKIIYNKLFK